MVEKIHKKSHLREKVCIKAIERVKTEISGISANEIIILKWNISQIKHKNLQKEP